MKDQSGHTNLWIAPTSRRSSPVRISSAAVEDSPFFLPDGDLVFRAIEGGSNFLYRMKTDGTGRRKMPRNAFWISLQCPRTADGLLPAREGPTKSTAPGIKAFALDGSATVPLCVTILPSQLGH